MADFEAFIRDKIENHRWTYARLSAYLQLLFPDRAGFSIRSLKRFCSIHGIHKSSRINSYELDEAVADVIDKVGPSYGRKMVTGLLASEGIRVSERRVGESLRHVNPGYNYARRTNTARQMNPVRYYAEYFGHKLHVDQSEKLVMFGCTHVCAVDGYSSKIVGFITLPVKNNYRIYADMFQRVLLQYGIWDQIRVDQGKEWVLMLFVQEQLAHLRRNTGRNPHIQTSSKQNHCVERMWVEVNARVNYPIKTVLVQMEQRDEINMNCDHEKFCVSWFTMHVTHVGTTSLVQAWNEHRIPGEHRGIPNVLMSNNNQVAQLNPSVIPSPDDALQQFQNCGGEITTFNTFGQDPLELRPDLITEREELFYQQHPNFDQIFHSTVNGNYFLFKTGLLDFIDISKQLVAQL